MMRNSIFTILFLPLFIPHFLTAQTMSIHMLDSTASYELAEVDSITFTVGTSLSFPIEAEVFLNHTFTRCEGIAFNGEGELFVAGDAALWHISTSGERNQVTTAYSNLGLAPTGDRDILFADFGPTNAFNHGYNRDGIVWNVTPEGTRTIAADGMGDPNFVLKLEDGRFLVSDDATDEIWVVDNTGEATIFTQSVNHPNGMVISQDGQWLYIAQMFRAISPNWLYDGSVWRIHIVDGQPDGDPVEVVNLGDSAGLDGLTMDILGRIYIACWNTGQIWRFDPENDELVLICQALSGVASMAFGQGEFDNEAIYATSTLQGTVWKIQVGIEGAPLHR